ncbi:MAG: hypothetical protein ACRCW2_10570, partial [Cellulosilyticaceae bacterium]
MKKIISLLIVGTVGLIGWQAYSDTQLTTENMQYYRNESITIESPFQKDPVADQLLREIQNLDQRNDGKEFAGNIYADRESGIVSIRISGSEMPKYQTQIQEIEQALGIEGMSAFIHDEAAYQKEKEMLPTLEAWGTITRTKVFGDVVVSTERTNNTADYKQYAEIKILRDQLKDEAKQTLANQFKTDQYVLKDWITGGQQEMLVLVNLAELQGLNHSERVLDEQGELLATRPVQVRYEIVCNQGNIQEVRMVAQSVGPLVFGEEEFEMLERVTMQLGIDTAKVETLVQSLL